MSTLENLFIFNGLDFTEKKEIIESLPETVQFKREDIIYSADEFPNAIGFVIKGKAIAVTNNGNRMCINTFKEGDCFGVAAVFGDSEQYVSTVVSKTDVEVLFLNEEQLNKMFENPKISLNYIRFLSDKIRFLNEKLCLLSCENAESRVYSYLSSAADSKGYVKSLKNMTLLSKMLGLGRASLYRSLDTLEKNGLILRENNEIKVIKNEKNC